MTPTTMERLTRDEFDQLSADEQDEHVQNALTTLRLSIPQSGAAAGAFIDVRLYVQELAGWAPSRVGALWPLHRAGIESKARPIDLADEYL
jgi:hypothetical protein